MSGHKQKERTIAFDFDSVIATYTGFVSSDHVTPPNRNVVDAIRALRDQGYKILMHSTRSDDFLRSYCEANGIPYDYINRRDDKRGGNNGKPVAYVYVDDRALCYTGQAANQRIAEMQNCIAYWQ